jgi:hypothetical protein
MVHDVFGGAPATEEWSFEESDVDGPHEPGAEAARAAHERIDRAVRTHRSSMHTLAVELLAFEEQGHAAVLGFGTVAGYAREVHGLSPRTVRDLLTLARSLRTLPVLDHALQAGDLVWTKARTLVPVLTDDNEQAWVDAARCHSVRELETMVASSLPGEAPPAPEDCRKLEETELRFTMPTVEAEFVQELIARERATAPEVERTDGEVLVCLLRKQIHDQQPASKERYQVVVELCSRCGRAGGRRAEMEDALLAEARCDAELVDLVSEGEERGSLSRTIPLRTRRAVLHAYCGVCAVPGCLCRTWVDLHHVHAYGNGGSHAAENLLPLCPAHHRMLHRGRLGVLRQADAWVFRFPWGPERRCAVPAPLRADSASPHVGDGEPPGEAGGGRGPFL